MAGAILKGAGTLVLGSDQMVGLCDMNTYFVSNESEMEQLGAQLVRLCPEKALIFLEGPLGAGKTTFVRGFLRALGYTGAVKSPTYTLVESYQVAKQRLLHFDLYRLEDPQELEFIGMRDYLSEEAIILIEWPDRGGAYLPKPDLRYEFEIEGTGRRVKEFRLSCLRSK